MVSQCLSCMAGQGFATRGSIKAPPTYNNASRVLFEVETNAPRYIIHRLGTSLFFLSSSLLLDTLFNLLRLSPPCYSSHRQSC